INMTESTLLLPGEGMLETLFMTFISGFFSFLIGLPIGILLFITRDGHFMASRPSNRTVAVFANIFRSIPFIILIVWMIPFARMVVGTSIGMNAAIVPLSIGAAPFVAR